MPERLLQSDRIIPERDLPEARASRDIPPGFEVIELPVTRHGFFSSLGGLCGVRPRTIILKSYLRERLFEAGAQDPTRLGSSSLVAGWIEGGRTRHALIRTGDEAWMLKAYRRGGWLGRWNSSRYWGRARFLEELRVAALAESFGVSTAEVLALILEPAGLGSLRAWLVTRYLPGVRPLHEYLGDRVGGHIFYAAGKVVRRMHEAEIDHHDLHVGNIMASVEADGSHALIVDWDRARARAVDSWSPYANLIRLWRSVQKGRLRDSRLLHRSMRAFVRGYFGGRPEAFREVRRYFRRRALFLGMRRWFWRASR